MKKIYWVLIVFLFNICSMHVSASGYTQEQYEEWQEDGTWEARQAFMSELNGQGNNVPVSLQGENLNSSWNDLADWNSVKASMPTTGEVKVLVFLVEFQDMKNDIPEYTANNVQRQLFEVDGQWNNEWGVFTGSMSEYYAKSSYGKLNLSGDVYGWYTASGNRSDYEDGAFGREKLVEELLQYYDEQIDYSQYDADGDGYIDAFYINYAGETGAWGEQWWSYMTNWYGLEGELYLDGVTPNGYVFLGHKYIEDDVVNTTFTTTIIHETGHLLGLPDYYDYEMTIGEGGGLGGVDMMDRNVGDHNPFSKLMLGWIDEADVQIAELGEVFSTYNLPSFEENKKILIVADNWTGSFFSEYYLLDYYTDAGLYEGLIDTDGGIRIWHVNAELDTACNNFVNDNSYSTYKLLKLYEADGKEEIAGDWLAAETLKDEDLYHTGDELTYATYPTSDYYGKKFTGINIQVGEKTTEGYSIKTKRDALNMQEPKIVNATPDDSGNNIYKDSIYRGRWITIEFDSVISIADVSKLSIVTLSGTEASMGTPSAGDKFITFPVYGDSSTKAMVRIEPGFVNSTSGVANTWNYSYNIDYFYPLAEENDLVLQVSYDENPQVDDTYYDEESGLLYATVITGQRMGLYWLCIDDNKVLKQVKLLEDAVNLSEIVVLDENVFFLAYNNYSGGSARRAIVFNKDGEILSEYANQEYDAGYVIYFSDMMKTDDGKVCYLTTANNEIWYYELSFDNNYNITEKKTKVMEYVDYALIPYKWYYMNGHIYGIGGICCMFDYNGDDTIKTETTQMLTAWEIEDNKCKQTDIVLPKEQGFVPIRINYILEQEDTYILFGVSSDGNYLEDGLAKLDVITLSKENYAVLDYTSICTEELGKNYGAYMYKVINVDGGYIALTSCSIKEDATNFFSDRPTNFYIGLDSSFNVDWVQVALDWHTDAIIDYPQKGLHIFASNYAEKGGFLGLYQLEPVEKQKVSFIIENNLMDEKHTEKVVLGGTFRYIIPQVSGYRYKVLVNGEMVPVSNNVLIYDSGLIPSGNYNVQIIYEPYVVESVVLSQTDLELKVGETRTLVATVKPEEVVNKEVEWISTDTAVATVDANGKVTAVAEGTATITATAKDGTGVSASCEVTVTEPVKEPVPETPESQVRAFVERMYTVALGRAAEAEGLNFYVQRLFAGDSNGACLAESFLCSPEFLNKGHSDAEYVKVLYRTFFDREPAAEEVKYWVDKLASGETKAFVLSGFVNSYEFDNLCTSYGISRGFMREDGKPLNPGIGRFAERMYTVVLERAGEKEGIEYWSLSIANGVCAPKDAAKNFFLSAEYVNKNTNDAQYITTLYKAFMDREPEAGGVEYWQDVLNNGATREQILEGFADSAEFKGIMASFGL